ncbi:MAG: hypothetical protein U5L08_07800 [Xanthomonadales bacterium]|nr:hypothetical protein [Xanthomonadales bacterium]
MRSKSEVIIADALHAKGVDYIYEKPLTIGDQTRYPDFTIEDMESGLMFSWEHCGMLHVPSYRRRWNEKLEWYRSNEIETRENGGGSEGTLIITRDESNGSIDSAAIARLIDEVIDEG